MEKISIIYIYSKRDNSYVSALIIETGKEYHHYILIISQDLYFTRKKISKYFFISKKCLIRIFHKSLDSLLEDLTTSKPYILKDFKLTKKDIYQILSNGVILNDYRFVTDYINHLIPYI